MANYLVSYDLNGNRPTHAEMDEHMGKAGWSRARILETVWYVGASDGTKAICNHVQAILSDNDSVIVARCDQAVFENLLVDDTDFLSAWTANS